MSLGFINKNQPQDSPKRPKRHLSSARVIIIGFCLVILGGSLLLMLPFSTASGKGASFTDALFTATSATCVTGLVIHDTATYWSGFGQAVILILIQIGGMGVVTVASFLALVAGKKISLRQRSLMQESLSAHNVGGIVRMTRFIITGTILLELVGALLLSPVFCKKFGFFKGVFYSIFHSISAFCNAGFDLMGAEGEFSSLTSFSSNAFVNIIIMLLIIIGGIGFITWQDVATHGIHFRKYRLQSKVALTMSAVLIVLPAIYFFAFEFSDHSGKERVLLSLFQSVTTRTAGFNTADLTKMSQVGIMLIICLMLIGGTTGSTAGGMKTTTVAVLISCAGAVFSRKNDATMFGRRVDDDTIKTAAAIFLMYVSLLLGGSFAISLIDGLPILESLFETGSALGTVGLSLGKIPQLSTISHLLLSAMMFFGRVGGLTLIFAAVSGAGANSRYPQEKITVG